MAKIEVVIDAAHASHVIHRKPRHGQDHGGPAHEEVLHKLGYIKKGHLISVTREDLVGQYVGQPPPRPRRS